LANFVTEEDLEKGSIYPPLNLIKDCSLQIAIKIAEYAYEKGRIKLILINFNHYCNYYHYLGIASHYPEPKDKKKFIESQMYDFNYDNPLPPKYSWPEETEPIKSKSIHDLTGDHLKKH